MQNVCLYEGVVVNPFLKSFVDRAAKAMKQPEPMEQPLPSVQGGRGVYKGSHLPITTLSKFCFFHACADFSGDVRRSFATTANLIVLAKCLGYGKRAEPAEKGVNVARVRRRMSLELPTHTFVKPRLSCIWPTLA